MPALLKAADDPDAAMSAWPPSAALGATIEAGDLPLLIARWRPSGRTAAEAKAAEDALRAACTRMPDREACAEKLVAAMAPAPAAVKCKFLEVLGAVGRQAGLAGRGRRGQRPRRRAPRRRQPAAGPMDDGRRGGVLLDLAKTSADDRVKARALRGYLRIARQFEMPVAQRLAMCREALPLCRHDDQRKVVLLALRRCPSAEALSLVREQLARRRAEGGRSGRRRGGDRGEAREERPANRGGCDAGGARSRQRPRSAQARQGAAGAGRKASSRAEIRAATKAGRAMNRGGLARRLTGQ